MSFCVPLFDWIQTEPKQDPMVRLEIVLMQNCIAAAWSCPTFLVWNCGMRTENMDTKVFHKKLISQRMNVIENVQFFVLRHVFTRHYIQGHFNICFCFFTTCFCILSTNVPQCFIILTESTLTKRIGLLWFICVMWRAHTAVMCVYVGTEGSTRRGL